jgi:ubiquinone/menaquinone biosynthesis C-methylase UbiE
VGQEFIDLWREALLLPGETDLVESGLRELAEYFDISREEARRRCSGALAWSKREWDAAPRRTADEIKDFYRTTQSYLFEHVWWHATDLKNNAANAEILAYAQSLGARDYLDFGSGVGANAILFARHGFRVTLADISTTMLEFARWRLRRRGIQAMLIDLNRQSLPRGQFDFATAVDVFEHLPRPETELKQLSRAMKEGGTLIFNCRAGTDEERPMHILKVGNPIWQALRASGFRELEVEGLRRLELSAARRTAQGLVEDYWYAAYDRARFSRALAPEVADGSRKWALHPQRVYFDRLEVLLQPGARWLDVGCGRQLIPQWMNGQAERETKLAARAGLFVGIDPDVTALRDNHSCRFKLNADAAALPFADAGFDLVTSNMVFEHVEDPLALLMEIRRVLRPGGRMLALTPNWLDIVTIAARAVPNRFHPAIVSRVETRGEADVHPTHFRFNRPGTIEQLLRRAGFNRCRIDPLKHPDVYSHVPIASLIESVWHRLAVRWPSLRGVLLIEAE